MPNKKSLFYHATILGAAALALILGGAPAHAAVNVSVTSGTYLNDAGFDFRTFDPVATPDTAERTVSGVRLLSQTFRTTQSITLSEIALVFARGGSGQDTRMRIYALTDTLASPYTTETLLLDVQFTMPAGLDITDNTRQALRIGLTGPEAITLPATTGTAGYALMFSLPQGSGNAFTWRFAQVGTNNATSAYVNGHIYYDALSIGSATRDGLFGIKGVPPEPPVNAVERWVIHE